MARKSRLGRGARWKLGFCDQQVARPTILDLFMPLSTFSMSAWETPVGRTEVVARRTRVLHLVGVLRQDAGNRAIPMMAGAVSS